MIYPLRDSDAERVVDMLASHSGKSVNDITEAAKTDAGFVFSGGHAALCVTSNVWYLKTSSQTEPEALLDERYKVYIDGVLTYSKTRQFQAAWLVDKLCQLMPAAREIRCTDSMTGKNIACWTRLTATDGGWIDRKKEQ